jgi:opacity protein-like surface antigen
MNKSISLVFAAVLLSAGALSAQEESIPQFEVGLTYSGVHLNAANTNGQRTGNGGSGSFEYNINRYLGVVADIGGYANTKTGIDDKELTYMFGPRLNLRHKRFTPYVQTLFGGGYAWSGPSNNNQNAFAFAIGGGLDCSLTKHIAIKPVQVEYLRTDFDSARLGDSTSSFGGHQNGVRYSAGIVFRFGEK